MALGFVLLCVVHVRCVVCRGCVLCALGFVLLCVVHVWCVVCRGCVLCALGFVLLCVVHVRCVECYCVVCILHWCVVYYGGAVSCAHRYLYSLRNKDRESAVNIAH